MCISLEILKEMTSEEQKKAEILLRKDSMNRVSGHNLDFVNYCVTLHEPG